jgi:chromosome segregation ATPase
MAEEPNNDRYEGRPLIAFNALIDGQKRTLWSLETAIEKYSRVNMEIAKFSRRLNAVQAEMLARTDTLQGDLFARMANINEGVLAELGKLSANMDELSGRIDTLVARMDALVARFEEAERFGDERTTDIKKLQLEMASQLNDILSTMQLATASSLDVKSLAELEKRMGI